MATTPRRNTRRRASNPETPPSQRQRLDGLFRDGQWWCNCGPRQRAARLQVSDQDKPTWGQWFYRCPDRPSCNFFLWEDKARLRETGLPGAQPASDDEEDLELAPRSKRPSFTQRQLTSYGVQVTPGRRRRSHSDGDMTASSDGGDDHRRPSKGKSVADTPCPTGSKRKCDALSEDSSGDDSFGQLDSDDERQMAALADTSASTSNSKPTAAQPNPKTPSTSSRTVDSLTGLPTPSTARTLFPSTASCSSKRHKTVSFEEAPETPSKPPTATTAATTPSTANATIPSSSSPTPTSSPSAIDAVHDPTDEVMTLLRPHNLAPPVLQSVRSSIATSVRRARGVALGRDSARAAARDKDARIARLQERVAALENKDRMMSNQITNMKAGIMKLYQDH
ncbi:hypothetical protein ACO1O0_000955 [Amphichorda felina]